MHSAYHEHASRKHEKMPYRVIVRYLVYFIKRSARRIRQSAAEQKHERGKPYRKKKMIHAEYYHPPHNDISYESEYLEFFHAYAVDIHKRNVQPECQKKPDEKRIVQNGCGSADGGKIFEHAPGNPEQEKQHGGTDARVAEIKEAETPDYLQKQLAEKQVAGQKF